MTKDDNNAKQPATAAEYPHIHACRCGTPVMEESVGHWQQQRIRELMAEAAAPTSGSLREALERLFRFHPAPWRSPATLQPWPNEAAYLDRIMDASGKPVFGPGNWKDACERNMALVHLVNALAATPEPEVLDMDVLAAARPEAER